MSKTQPKRPRLVVSDIDGTVLGENKRLTQATRQAAVRLAKAGIRLSLASSRPTRGLVAIAEDLGVTEPCVAMNGGALVYADGRPLDALFMGRDDAQTAIDRLIQLGLDAWLYTQDRWLVTQRRPGRIDREIDAVGFEPEQIPTFDPFLGEATKILGYSEDSEAVSKAQVYFAGLKDLDLSATRSSPIYLDITRRDADKGSGVTRLSRILDIPLHQIATIGDAENDVPMFRVSGIAIAMAQATPEVKASASHFTSDNAHEGFAEAIEMLLSLPEA
jgi:Cof subfamily protein (haloacid dehalogenase superfamily)